MSQNFPFFSLWSEELRLMQTKAVLEKGVSIGGKTSDAKIIKDIHALLMENILTSGVTMKTPDREHMSAYVNIRRHMLIGQGNDCESAGGTKVYFGSSYSRCKA